MSILRVLDLSPSALPLCAMRHALCAPPYPAVRSLPSEVECYGCLKAFLDVPESLSSDGPLRASLILLAYIVINSFAVLYMPSLISSLSYKGGASEKFVSVSR